MITIRKASWGIISIVLAVSFAATAQPFYLPTANRSLFERGQDEKFLVGTAATNWMTGGFGCVRTGGWQMHEGLDIRCLQRDGRGEPIDPVRAAADGTIVYINRRPSLSNYGNYIVLRHQIDQLEVYSLYAHLREFAGGLAPGQAVKAGQQIAIMGRTSNTRQAISRERAHVHFEINFLVNDRFSSWHQQSRSGERNDHGEWNGHNLLGIDPLAVLLAHQSQRERFSLLSFVRQQPELCRVHVRSINFPWLKRYPQLITGNSRADKEGIAGYELALNFNGLPFELIPRASSELRSKSRFQLLSVNEHEQQKNPCCRLVSRKGSRWELTSHGVQLLELLTY